MPVRVKRLGFLVLAIAVLMIYWGCSQPGDVVTPVSASRLSLSPERLPTNPTGTVYQLWVAGGGDTIPVSKFAWNFDSNAFYDSVGTSKRADSNAFILHDDILSFKTVFVSVEPVPDPQPNKPGAIMLIDTVVTLEPNTVRLKFPRSDSLYNGFLFYNMATPSDSEINTNNGYGVWFSGYNVKSDSTRDTVALLSYSIDSSGTCTPIGDRDPLCDSIFVHSFSNIRTITDTSVFGFDTFVVRYVRFDSILTYESTRPFTQDILVKRYDLEPDSGISTAFIREEFVQSSLYLPDYSSFGWVYRGWVMSPVLDGGCGNANFTKPAWKNPSAINEYLPQNGSKMLSTGAFTDYGSKDVGVNPNPYSLGPRVPSFPGEDFLRNLPCGGGLPTDGFVPAGGGASGANGCVFISLEPANFHPTTPTNFPLVVLVSNIPTNRAVVNATEVSIAMRNWTSAIHGDLQGFPLVTINIERL